MVGWGWVVLAGEMIIRAGSVGSALAFVAGAIMVTFVGLTYAELTSALSRAGGEISFTFCGLGPWASYICGWTLVLAYLSVCAFEAVALPIVAGYMFPGLERGYLYTVAGWRIHLSWVVLGVIGALTIGFINFRGIRMASYVQWSAAALLLAVGIAFFIPGNFRGDTANLVPHFTGLEGFFGVVIMTPFLFVGFDVIPQIAEEIDLPFRAVGRLILISIVIALGWYVLVQWTVGVTLPNQGLGERQLPTADAMAAVYGSPWGGRVLVLGGLMGILTSWNAFFIGASRLLFAMSRGAMLPAVFTRLHPRFQSPVAVILLITCCTVVAPFFGRPALVWLVDAGSFATVVAYVLVAISFLSIRRRFPNLSRPYRVPAPRIIGAMAVLTSLFFLALYLPGSPAALAWPFEWAIVLVWALVGALFAVWSRRRAIAVGRAAQAKLILGDYAEALEGAASDSEQLGGTR
jgi:amino acid transporter